MKPIAPPTLGSSTTLQVGSTNLLSIYVPTGSVDAYKTAQYWSSYAGAISGYEF